MSNSVDSTQFEHCSNCGATLAPGTKQCPELQYGGCETRPSSYKDSKGPAPPQASADRCDPLDAASRTAGLEPSAAQIAVMDVAAGSRSDHPR